MADSALISIAALALTSLAILAASFKRLPDVGVLFALLVTGVLVWRRPGGLEMIGFWPSDNWPGLIALSVCLGVAIALLANTLLEPLVERLTGQPHDIRMLEFVRGDLKALLQVLALVWLLVAFVEETVFRGFLMSELARLLGAAPLALAVSMLYSSVLFGLAHWYQGPSGALSATVLGLILGAIFIWAGFNLWPVILIHGAVDTVSLILLYANWDQKIKHAIIKPNPLEEKEAP